MNDDITRMLAEGDPPDAAMLEKIAAQFSASAKPVRSLPSNLTLWSISFGIFIALALIVAKIVQFAAVAVLSDAQMVAYYGVLLLFGALFHVR